eukprot:TRINITY_DN4130_c0_g1_i1.p1 TRINITY_DN4130_c0_g1~~TRINITY_DN4130_c0_g1_i1.p1  ORF type:complete len:362 (+),score=65.95 TRINITY_DN4130_c0_g1_i1:64-1149(+)
MEVDGIESVYMDTFTGNDAYMETDSSEFSSSTTSGQSSGRDSYVTFPTSSFQFNTSSIRGTSPSNHNKKQPPPVPANMEETLFEAGVPILLPSAVRKSTKIDAGFFGEVFHGEYVNSLQAKERVALKVITKQRFRLRTDWELFLHEILIHSKLSHENVTPLLGVVRLVMNKNDPEPSYFMVTPYMTGGTLHNLVVKNPHILTPDFSKSVLQGIAEGMAYLHSLKIIHRDLSSSNVLLDKEGTPRISDFGLSRYKSMDETMSAAVGALVGMAPEVWKGERYDDAADVYSFAIVAWETWSKESPCGNEVPSLFASMVAINNYRPNLDLSSIPTNWKKLIARCWSADPVSRPPFQHVLHLMSAL